MIQFVTSAIREASGQCQPVHDGIMQNLNIERIGICSACGHKIVLHCGINVPDIGYMYVGKDCKKILCNPESKQINPESGSKFIDDKNRETIVLSESDFLKLHKIGHGRDYESGIIDGWIVNQFVANIATGMRENHNFTSIWTLTIKQYDCIKKYL